RGMRNSYTMKPKVLCNLARILLCPPGSARILRARVGHSKHAGSVRSQGTASAISAVARKNVAPASSRQTVLLTQKGLSRLTCRRDAGATILSHDPCLCGEVFGCGRGPPLQLDRTPLQPF